MNNPYIWVLLDSGQTKELYAELDDETIDHVASILFDIMEDEEDPDAPKDIEDVKHMIRQDVIDGEEHAGYYMFYELRRQELNALIEGKAVCEDPEFKVEKGTEVFEAVMSIVMGCDMSCLQEPIGYFSKPPKELVTADLDWNVIKLL